MTMMNLMQFISQPFLNNDVYLTTTTTTTTTTTSAATTMKIKTKNREQNSDEEDKKGMHIEKWCFHVLFPGKDAIFFSDSR